MLYKHANLNNQPYYYIIPSRNTQKYGATFFIDMMGNNSHCLQE